MFLFILLTISSILIGKASKINGEPTFKKDACIPIKDGSNYFGRFMKTYPMLGHVYPEVEPVVQEGIQEALSKTDKEREYNISTVQEIEESMKKDLLQKAQENKAFLDTCERQYFEIDIGGGSQKMKVLMIKSKNAPKTGNVPIVDTMGGAGLYGQIWFKQIELCNKTHQQGDNIVFFTAAFRRPPLIKQPESFKDMHKLIVYLYNNPKKYGIDGTKIGVYGVSGGGYIQSGLGMILAQNNHTYMVKSYLMVTPQLDDTIFTTNKENLNYVERFYIPVSRSIMKLHGIDIEKQRNDPNLYPSKMPLKLLKKFPRTVLTSVEFDIFRSETDKFAHRLKEAGVLDEYVVYPGSIHSFSGLPRYHQINMDQRTNFKKWIDCYLRA